MRILANEATESRIVPWALLASAYRALESAYIEAFGYHVPIGEWSDAPQLEVARREYAELAAVLSCDDSLTHAELLELAREYMRERKAGVREPRNGVRRG